MMIPTNDDGMFEAVDQGGTVVGHGIVTGDTVDFAYSDGNLEAQAVVTLDEFATVWSQPQCQHLTLRAAT